MQDESRVEMLEFKVAHLEGAVQDLSDVLYRQQQQLDAAEQRFRLLAERMSNAEGVATPEMKYEVPPHY